jgi:hypothetical protein
MTNWKRLLETNPEPSLLDAIAHAEKQQPAWAKASKKLKDLTTYIDTFGQRKTHKED